MGVENRGQKRFVLRIKSGREAERKGISRKLFLGVRFKETSTLFCSTHKPEDRK
jgi:hypothetical protein